MAQCNPMRQCSLYILILELLFYHHLSNTFANLCLTIAECYFEFVIDLGMVTQCSSMFSKSLERHKCVDLLKLSKFLTNFIHGLNWWKCMFGVVSNAFFATCVSIPNLVLCWYTIVPCSWFMHVSIPTLEMYCHLPSTAGSDNDAF